MALDTFENLKASIESWLDNSDLTDKIEDFIRIAEARHQREVRIRQMLARQPLIINNRYVDLPCDLLEAKAIRIITDTARFPVVQLNLDDLSNRSKVTEGLPKFFNIHAQVEFDRAPDQTYTGEIIFYLPLDALADSNQTNDLLDRAPDVYLYSALAASAPFLHEDERIQTWEGLYTIAKDDLNMLEKRAAQIGPAVATPSGTVV